MAPPAGHLGLRLQLGRVFHDQQIKIGFGAGVARGPGAERASFRKYDMLSQRWRPWARLYPGVELLVGLGELLLLQATALALLVAMRYSWITSLSIAPAWVATPRHPRRGELCGEPDHGRHGRGDAGRPLISAVDLSPWHQLLANGISGRQCGYMPSSFSIVSTEDDITELLISADVTSFGCAGNVRSFEGGEWRFHHHLSHL